MHYEYNYLFVVHIGREMITDTVIQGVTILLVLSNNKYTKNQQ